MSEELKDKKEAEKAESSEEVKEESKETEPSGKKNKSWIIIAGVGGLVVLLVALSFFLIKRWEGSSKFVIDPSIDASTETDDRIFLLPEALYRTESDGVPTVVVFGNDTFGDTEYGVGVCRLLQENSTATIYDCTFPGSTMMTRRLNRPEETDYPMDYYSLYWLWESVQNGTLDLQENVIPELEGIDKDLYKEHIDLLKSIDFNKVDYILICYDGHDYLAGQTSIYQKDAFMPLCMNGVIYGIHQKVFAHYPEIQVAFVAPSFCYAVDENGEKIPGNLQEINGEKLTDSILFMKEKTQEYGISYVDNYFGVAINEETADQYLTEDNVVPNLEGKKLIAAHIINKVLKRIEITEEAK